MKMRIQNCSSDNIGHGNKIDDIYKYKCGDVRVNVQDQPNRIKWIALHE